MSLKSLAVMDAYVHTSTRLKNLNTDKLAHVRVRGGRVAFAVSVLRLASSSLRVHGLFFT